MNKAYTEQDRENRDVNPVAVTKVALIGAAGGKQPGDRALLGRCARGIE